MKIKINDITINVDETEYNSEWGEKEIVKEITETVNEYAQHCDFDFEETQNMMIEDYCRANIMSEEDVKRLCNTFDLNRR